MRNLDNYPHKVLFIRDSFTGKEDKYVAVPMKLNLNDSVGVLIVEVWRNREAFENLDFAEKSNEMSKFLPITQPVIDAYKDLFGLVKSKSLEFLHVDSSEFDLQMIDIDLNNLQVQFLAQHKARTNRNLRDSTANLLEFEELKTKYSEIVLAFYGFAFDYMATNKTLAEFK